MHIYYYTFVSVIEFLLFVLSVSTNPFKLVQELTLILSHKIKWQHLETVITTSNFSILDYHTMHFRE